MEGFLLGSSIGGSLGLLKGVLWVCFWGILTEIFLGQVNVYEIGSLDGFFLGNY